jgi:iduronate 2-sulfatase
VIERTDAQLSAEGSTRRGMGPAFEAADVPDDAYHDGKDADHAIKTLNEVRDQPFFLAVGFHKPHLPFNAPKRHWDRYDRESLPLALNTSAPENVTEYSLTEFGELRGYFGMPKEGPIPEDLSRTLVHGYCACVSYMDSQVGRVLDEVEQLGLKENTVVILWGDHGWKLGEHGSWCKHTNFDIDTHAPMIIRSPERGKPGAKASGLTEFVDMYPSLCDLCDLPQPDHLEGQSFVPLMEEPDRTWKQAAFSQYPRKDVMGYTIKTDDFRYTEWQSRETGDVKARELYDHRQDAAENVNTAGDDRYAETVSELEKVIKKGWEAAKAQPS